MVIIFTSNTKGGIIQFAFQMAETFENIGYDCRVMLPDAWDSSGYEQQKRQTIQYHKVKTFSGSDTNFIQTVERLRAYAVSYTHLDVYKRQQMADELPPILRRVWIIFLAAAFIIIAFLVVDANVLGHGERYSSLANYLVFNDEWGTSRGYIWRKSMEAYGKFPLKHKLFGYGPDTFGILTTDKFFGDMINATGLVFDLSLIHI